jgi:hypothetical protein
MTVWYGACALYAGQLRLQTQTHTQRTCNTYCFFHANNSCTMAPQCYVIRALPALFYITPSLCAPKKTDAIFRAAHLAVTWSRSLSEHVTVNTLPSSRPAMYLHKPINCNFCTSWGAVGSPVISMLPAWCPYCGGLKQGGCNQIWEE